MNQFKILILILAISIFSCSQKIEQVEGKNPDISSVKTNHWIIQEIDGKLTIEKTTKDGMGTTGKPFINFDFEKKHFNTFAGCNTINGNIAFSENKLSFSSIATTVMACQKELMQQEFRLKELLEQITHYKLQDQNLDFYAGEKLVLKLTMDKEHKRGEK